MTAVQKKMEEFIRRERLLEMGDRVVLGVSGGADSVCMMELFAAIREAWQLELLVVHVHHGLRGAEADRDAAFVQAEAEKSGIDCVVERRDVRSLAAERGLSLEEAGRDVRYEILREYAKNWTSQKDGLRDGCGSETLELAGCRPAKIAVAHHQEDQAETILHNLFRGSGLKGLGGMSAKRGQIIRPLLCLEKKEILEYLEKRHIAYCEDSTNRENEYTRNRLRNELIPQIRREINEKAVEHIAEAGERLRQADAYFEEQAEKIWREYGVTKTCNAEGDVTGLMDGTKMGAESQAETADEIIYGMERSVFLKEPPIVRTYVLRHMISHGYTVPKRHHLRPHRPGNFPFGEGDRQAYKPSLWVDCVDRIRFLVDFQVESVLSCGQPAIHFPYNEENSLRKSAGNSPKSLYEMV